MKRLFAALVLCLAAALPATANDVFSHPADNAQLTKLLAASTGKLKQALTLRGAFTQRKTLSEIPKPLVSTGDFVFARDAGIYWHTRTPLDSEFILTAAGMVQNDNGSESMRVSSQQQPGLKAAATIFFAMFAMDLKTLSENFDLYGAGTPARWQVGLRPKGAMAAVFKEGVISGGAAIEQVLLRDANGDVTEISLHQLQVSPQALGQQERVKLGFEASAAK